MTISEILRTAKETIQQRGWTQRTLIARGGSVCALGAISIADGSLRIHAFETCQTVTLSELSDEANDAVQVIERVATGADDDGLRLTSWNDVEDRTVEDVLAAFDAAVAIAEQQETALLVTA